MTSAVLNWETTNPRDLFRSAYENRYTWDSGFPGFTATIEIQQGGEVYTGSIQINSDLTIQITGIEAEAVHKSVQTQLNDIVTHRQRAPFEQVHGQNHFTLGETDETGAIAIYVSGTAMGSEYKLRQGEICYVKRVMGPMTFFIHTYESFNTGSGYVPTRYEAIFRQTETGTIVQKVTFEDHYEPVGNYFILTRQTLHTEKSGQTTTTTLTYSDVQLRDSDRGKNPA